MPSPADVLQAVQIQALSAYLDHESAPMIVMNTDYEILSANSAYQRQFAGAGHTVVGKKCYAVSHHYQVPCDQAGEHCPMQGALASMGPQRVLHIHHTPRGPEHVDVDLRPLVDEQGRVVGFVERLHTVRHASVQATGQGLVGKSSAFNRALGELQRVAPSELPVLLLGESGSGKELFARALHEASARASGPFVVVDCSGLTESLFESELFGYEKGAFTGAHARKIGLVEAAKGGTLFLDEIGDVALGMQVKLLRLIESGSYRRVGAVEMQQTAVRLVAATHKPLQEMVRDGSFRQDLYYRISAFPIALPALRERRDDIPLLVESLLRRGSSHAAADRAAPRMHASPAAMVRLLQHQWPGNIRELRNVLERARLFADDGVIQPQHLGLLPELKRESSRALQGQGQGGQGGQGAHGPQGREEGRDQGEADLAVLAPHFKGTRKALAASLGLSERTLYRRLKAAGVE